jgi:hypothetical protein
MSVVSDIFDVGLHNVSKLDPFPSSGIMGGGGERDRSYLLGPVRRGKQAPSVFYHSLASKFNLLREILEQIKLTPFQYKAMKTLLLSIRLHNGHEASEHCVHLNISMLSSDIIANT